MKEDIFGGFTAVAQSLSSRATSIEATDDDDRGLPGPDDLDNNSIRTPNNTQITENEGGDHIPLKPTDEEGGDEGDGFVEEGDEGDEGSIGELGEAESDIAAFLQEKLFDQFGFEMGDETFGTVEEVANFVKSLVEENSAPKYADETLAKMDEFVRNGGSVQQYLELTQGGVDTKSIDIESEDNQKRVISELLKNKGYSETKVKRAVERYEDAGVLQEEAEDALEMLSEYKEQMSERLLEDQKKQKQLVEEEQQKYVESVKQEIEALKDVRGVPISSKKKNELFDYIFRPTKTGRTRYQEDYVKTQRNMIESAFFTMEGDAFVQNVQKKATSEAASRLRKKLANKGSRGKNQSGQGGSNISDIWNVASSQLRSPF